MHKQIVIKVIFILLLILLSFLKNQPSDILHFDALIYNVPCRGFYAKKYRYPGLSAIFSQNGPSHSRFLAAFSPVHHGFTPEVRKSSISKIALSAEIRPPALILAVISMLGTVN